MKKEFTVRFAQMNIGICAIYDSMEKCAKDYLTEKEPLFSVDTTEEKIREELLNATSANLTAARAEALCLYREIAEKIPLYDGVVFHGAAVEYGGKAYIFTAPSGTGKTTHISLWKRFLGDKVIVINGDKPILTRKDGEIHVHGTPFAGKEGWQTNCSAPLGGICILSRGEKNIITPVAPKDAFPRLYLQTYKPYRREAMEHTMSMVKALCQKPCFFLSCDISEEACKTSFEALTGESWEAAVVHTTGGWQ